MPKTRPPMPIPPKAAPSGTIRVVGDPSKPVRPPQPAGPPPTAVVLKHNQARGPVPPPNRPPAAMLQGRKTDSTIETARSLVSEWDIRTANPDPEKEKGLAVPRPPGKVTPPSIIEGFPKAALRESTAADLVKGVAAQVATAAESKDVATKCCCGASVSNSAGAKICKSCFKSISGSAETAARPSPPSAEETVSADTPAKASPSAEGTVAADTPAKPGPPAKAAGAESKAAPSAKETVMAAMVRTGAIVLQEAAKAKTVLAEQAAADAACSPKAASVSAVAAGLADGNASGVNGEAIPMKGVAKARLTTAGAKADESTKSANGQNLKKDVLKKPPPVQGGFRSNGSSSLGTAIRSQEPAVANAATLTTVGLHGLCDTRLIDLEEWPEFFDDMMADIEHECKLYGDLTCITIEKSAPLGSAFVRFAAPSQAQKCLETMNGRVFAGRKVTAELQDIKYWDSAVDVIHIHS